MTGTLHELQQPPQAHRASRSPSTRSSGRATRFTHHRSRCLKHKLTLPLRFRNFLLSVCFGSGARRVLQCGPDRDHKRFYFLLSPCTPLRWRGVGLAQLSVPPVVAQPSIHSHHEPRCPRRYRIAISGHRPQRRTRGVATPTHPLTQTSPAPARSPAHSAVACVNPPQPPRSLRPRGCKPTQRTLLLQVRQLRGEYVPHPPCCMCMYHDGQTPSMIVGRRRSG